MPGIRVHTYIDRWYFGKSYYKIHRAMDKPFKRLGRRHRIMFHDPATAIAIAQRLYPGDPNAVQAALFHIYIDDLCSRDPRFRELLEIMVRFDSMRRKRKRRK